MAPKKAKKEKKKEQQLTPEEKKAKADVMAAKAEEARKRKEAAAKAHLLQLQKLEEQYSKENLQKIHDKWRRLMRVTKVEDLLKDSQQLSKYYEHKVHGKDVMISKLMQQLQEAEQQRQTAFSKHLQIVDGLIDIHNTRMKELNDMIHAMENDFKEVGNELRQEFESSREEIKAYLESTDSKTQAFKRMAEKDRVTARLIEQRMRRLLHLHESISYRRTKIATDSREWEAINKAMRDQKDEINKQYQKLKKKMTKLHGREHEELKAMSKISEDVGHDLSKKLEMAERIVKLGELNSKLELEHEKISLFDPLDYSVFPGEKSAITTSKQATLHDPLEDLQLGPECTKQPQLLGFKGSKEHADSTIFEGQFSSDLQKVKSHLQPHETNQISRLHVTAFATDGSGEEIHEWSYLSKFYKRYNKAVLDKMALELHRKHWMSQNVNLKTKLKKTLQTLTRSDDEVIKNFKLLLDTCVDLPEIIARPNTIMEVIR